MYMIRCNPTRTIDHFFNQLWNTWPELEDDSVTWRPRVDIKETIDGYEILADIPGLDKKDIKISLHDNVLTLKGDRKITEKKDNEHSYHVERLYGSFSRSFTLPEKVNPDNIKANYKDGVLRITLQKSEETKPREIEIR